MDPISSNIKATLRKGLDDIGAPGPFASAAKIPQFADPHIWVGQHGPIALPLNEHDARVIVQASHQAPFGKGEATVVDESVRKTWELGHDAFEIRNAEWEGVVKDAVKDVARQIGVREGEVGAELYKMLLYEKGAHFKAHQDSEKAPGMFGTMVICLPSPHTGGEVRLKHLSEKKAYATSKVDHCYLWWYSDVIHEVQEITSGYRWVLTYNLVRKGSRADLSTLRYESSILRNTVGLWKSHHTSTLTNDFGELIYVLEHKYTEANLKMDLLKSQDLGRVMALKQACEANGFSIFLAALERQMYGGVEYDYDEYDRRRGRYGNYYGDEDDEGDESRGDGQYHDLTDIYEDDYAIKSLMDLQGMQVMEDININATEIIQDKAFEGADPDEEDYEGFTGNSGASARHWYRKTAVVIIPRHRAIDFLMGPFKNSRGYRLNKDGGIASLIEYLASQFAKDPMAQTIKEGLRSACQLVLSKNTDCKKDGQVRTYEMFSDSVISCVVKASLALVDLNIFAKAFDCYQIRTPPEIFLEMGKALDWISLADMKPGLNRCNAHYVEIHLHVNAFRNFLGGSFTNESLHRNQESGLTAWVMEELENFLEDVQTVSILDAGPLLEVALAQDSVSQYLNDKIIPVVERHISRTPFVIAFINAVCNVAEDAISEDETLAIFKKLVPLIGKNFVLVADQDETSSVNKRQRTAYEPASPHGKIVDAPPSISAQELHDFLEHCFALSFHDDVQAILTAFSTASVKREEYNTLVIPLLYLLTSLLPRFSISLGSTHTQEVFRITLLNYLTHFVSHEPRKPQDWARPTVTHWCEDCISLNRFLSNPNAQEGRFSLNEKRRNHLDRQLSASHCKRETERMGIPYTLVVTKTNRGHEELLAAWKQRVKLAKTKIKGLGELELKEALGDSYDSIMQLRAIRLKYSGGPARAQAQLPQLQGSRLNSGLGGGKEKYPWMVSGQPRDATGSGLGTFALGPVSGNVVPGRTSQTPMAIANVLNAPNQGSGSLKRKAEDDFVDLTGDD
ncbi:uncharacterized protein BDZ99DRAFT_565102 [Mytilinidion resinicola]|uniref:Prolyl 4-hydroxylase alpha subunit Fe(2+) 2OG dioxygenase domain-containing protein n=1 Tax=Mytilinidion resinicola TaxID=574789 RepID=A0A6A6Z957_9PEZI|nr:uncharacterized protein BDZ99DRAFT_565102 [Mytilinidion resinicola]KAF2817338.1 hypothetical protein BDZ99DRAFT_565102 [Mytilinidion resinicola]